MKKLRLAAHYPLAVVLLILGAVLGAVGMFSLVISIPLRVVTVVCEGLLDAIKIRLQRWIAEHESGS